MIDMMVFGLNESQRNRCIFMEKKEISVAILAQALVLKPFLFKATGPVVQVLSPGNVVNESEH